MPKQILYTTFNYEKVFRVEVDKFNIKIFKHTWELLEQDEKSFVLELKSHQCIYVGFQQDDPSDAFYIGNTLLIRITDKKYMFVGEMIYTFDLNESILEYSSNVIKGQSFPYFTTQNHCYLLLDNVRMPLIFKGNPYEYYYEVSQEGVEDFNYNLIYDNYLI